MTAIIHQNDCGHDSKEMTKVMYLHDSRDSLIDLGFLAYNPTN